MRFVQSTQHEYFQGITVLRNMVLQHSIAMKFNLGFFPHCIEMADVVKTDWYRMADVCLFLMMRTCTTLNIYNI